MPCLRSGLCLATLLTVGAASAQGGFAELDANGDGQISRQEALAGQRAAFENLDADGNGQLTADELILPEASARGRSEAERRRAQRQARERWFANLDRDNSRRIEPSEYQAAMTPYFDNLDANNDGALDAEELGRAIERDTPSGGG